MAIITEGEIVKHPLTGDAWGDTYGVRLWAADGQELFLPDVDTCRPRVERFLQWVLGEEADEVQLSYLLEDFLAEEYTPHL